MRVSLNTVKQYTGLELPPVDELVARINAQLGGVEEVIDLADKYKDPVIVKVVDAEQHPNADRLRVCKVDDSGVVADVPRDENGLVQVVCGAPNARAGMYAVWLPPGSAVPASYETEEPFVLSARELRGVLSQGMLAAGDELAINSDHDGIIEITEKDIMPQSSQSGEPSSRNPSRNPSSRNLGQAQGAEAVELDGLVGRKFAEVFRLDDTIIDIENKMFTHRPDLFGQLGVAREISAILLGASDKSLRDEDTRYVNPDWYSESPQFERPTDLELEVFNDAPDKAPRFMAVALDGVTVGPSPLWLQTELVRWGGKPINHIVDLTNYIMLLTAQPTHAYDYDKLRGHKLGVRMAQDGEKITLLNGKEYNLTDDDIVIADGEGAVGLAGIMGGGNSEVSSETTRIVLEVANFDMYAVRKSSMRHGVFTDALTRFNKGQSPLQNGVILKRLMQLMPARQASPVYDLPDKTGLAVQDSVHGEARVSIDFINQRLGMSLTENQISSLLRRANFAVYPAEDDSGKLCVTAPYWRTDIELPEDIVEEVGRLYGFDKLPRELPRRSAKPATRNITIAAKQELRSELLRMGANEVLTYSFVHEQVLQKVDQNPEKAFRLGNALSPDLQYYRLSVLPSLLDKVHMNVKSGYDEFALYEIGKAHHKDEFDSEGLPREFPRLAMVYADKSGGGAGAAYYQVKCVVDELVRQFGGSEAELRYQPLREFDFGPHDALRQLAAPFDPQRAAMVWLGERFYGVVGELKTTVVRGFKLPAHTAAAELFISLFERLAASDNVRYQPLSRYPSIAKDISVKVSRGLAYDEIHTQTEASLSCAVQEDVRIKLSPVSIYQPDNDTLTKVITLHVTFVSDKRTLTDDEINGYMAQLATSLQSAIDAIVI